MIAISDMTLRELVALIRKNWRPVNYAAIPYLQALSELHSLSDVYIQESGKSLARYFLANAGTWRGPVAKAVKDELKKRTK